MSKKKRNFTQMSLFSYFDDADSKETIEQNSSNKPTNPAVEDDSDNAAPSTSKQKLTSKLSGTSVESVHSSEISESVIDEALDDAGRSESPSAECKTREVSSALGCAITEMPSQLIQLPTLKPSPNHHIFFRPHLSPGRPPRPYPDSYRDKWDGEHVRMPCSSQNMYPVSKGEQSELKRRWDMIENCLRKPMSSTLDIEESILTYNARYNESWKFDVLHSLFLDHLPAEESRTFLQSTYPALAALALNLPNLVTQPIPLLRRGYPASLTFTQQQVASLLANAFFCTFPRRNSRSPNSEFTTYPTINFNSLFMSKSWGQNPVSNPSQLEKLHCLIHYFNRVIADVPCGTVTFTRRCLAGEGTQQGQQNLPLAPNWGRSVNKFNFRICVTAQGTIEDAGVDMLQADFANKMVGGGVLRAGCVQEEIRFVLCPELILSRLFTECLGPREALVIEGCERFSLYTGYGRSFHWAGDYRDDANNTRDNWGRWRTAIVAIDASVFNSYWDQFKPAALTRELNKAYCGFADLTNPEYPIPRTVATGNWGCGAFRGDHRLKALLQMMVCAEARKDLTYFTFGDEGLRNDIYKIYKVLQQKGTTVGEVWQLLADYRQTCSNSPPKKRPNVFTFLGSQLGKNAASSSSSAAAPPSGGNESVASTLPYDETELGTEFLFNQ